MVAMVADWLRRLPKVTVSQSGCGFNPSVGFDSSSCGGGIATL